MITTKKVEFLDIGHRMVIYKREIYNSNKTKSFLTQDVYILRLINKK